MFLLCRPLLSCWVCKAASSPLKKSLNAATVTVADAKNVFNLNTPLTGKDFQSAAVEPQAPSTTVTAWLARIEPET